MILIVFYINIQIIEHPCGTGIGLEEYKYIYFVNPHPDYIGRTLCVKKCPKLLPNQSETDGMSINIK